LQKELFLRILSYYNYVTCRHFITIKIRYVVKAFSPQKEFFVSVMVIKIFKIEYNEVYCEKAVN